MKSITISDGGNRFTLLIREDVDLPPLPIQEQPAHIRFLNWWKEECRKRGIEYVYRVAEPQGHKIIQSLLKKHSIEELQELANHCFLDHGGKLREQPYHFAIFASLVPTMKQELKRE